MAEKENKPWSPVTLTENSGSFQAAIPRFGKSGKRTRTLNPIETISHIVRQANEGEVNLEHQVILRLFDDVLDPNNQFWMKTGINQSQLTSILSRGQMLAGFTFQQLVTELNKIPIVSEPDDPTWISLKDQKKRNNH